MDIKERKAFEEALSAQTGLPIENLHICTVFDANKNIYTPSDVCDPKDDVGVHRINIYWNIWQAAKAQAVSEQDQQIWATSNLTWKEVAFRVLSCKVLKTTQNWVHVKNIASVGSTTASLICEKLGVNPDGTKFDLIEPQEST